MLLNCFDLFLQYYTFLVKIAIKKNEKRLFKIKKPGRRLQKISFQDVSLIVDRDILLSQYAIYIITLSCNSSTKDR